MALTEEVEVLIFSSQQAIDEQKIKDYLQKIHDREVEEEEVHVAIQEVVDKYADHKVFHVQQTGGGYVFMTKPVHGNTIKLVLKHEHKRRLSVSCLETLSIIAYKQPITKHGINAVRGVNSDYALQRLMEKNLIEVKGYSKEIGRPLLYGTNKQFMDYFGINDLKELPILRPHSSSLIGQITNPK